MQLFPYEGKLPAHAAWFGEDQGRYVLEASPELAEEIIERARLLALPARVVGRVGGDALALKDETALAVGDLRAAHESWLPQYMGPHEAGLIVPLTFLHAPAARTMADEPGLST